MNKKTVTMFNEALERAIELSRGVAPAIGVDMTLVRDFLGRIHVLLPGSRERFAPELIEVLNAYTSRLSGVLGVYASLTGVGVFFSQDLMFDEGFERHPDRQLLITEGEFRIWLLDRQITGQDWMRAPFVRLTKNPRFTFFGIKGGVGRSSALVVWAWHLAKLGKRVLIFDLDLESPGVSSTLLPNDSLPDFGLVDWFVEGGVGQERVIESEMTATSPIARDFEGDVLVVPAFGKKTGEYLPKLSRCYSENPTVAYQPWAARLNQVIERLEEKHKPDVVILDSRAGIHDIAAAAVTRLGAESLLFAVDSPQTWTAYALLFQSWKRHPALDSFRTRLQLIGSMVPETGQDEYRNRLLQNSWDIFREGIYDEEISGVVESFSFDLRDEDAPHYPWPVYWQRALQEFNPVLNNDWNNEQMLGLALGDFMERMDRRLDSMKDRDI